MTSFYYYDQNPLGFCFLVQIRAVLLFNPTGVTKFKYERKNDKDSGRRSKMTPSCEWPFRPNKNVYFPQLVLSGFFTLLETRKIEVWPPYATHGGFRLAVSHCPSAHIWILGSRVVTSSFYICFIHC